MEVNQFIRFFNNFNPPRTYFEIIPIDNTKNNMAFSCEVCFLELVGHMVNTWKYKI